MGIEDTLRGEVEELKSQVAKIKDNELKHIDARLDTLESRLRAPLSSLYLLAAFVIFVGIIGFISLPAIIGWPIVGVCVIVLVLALIGIKRIAATKHE